MVEDPYFFFFNDTATTEIYTYWHTLSLHDALPIYFSARGVFRMDWSRTTWSSLAVLMRWIAAKPLAHVEMAGRCPQRIGERTASGSIGKYPKRDFCAAQGPLAEGILSPESERMGRR